MQLAAPPTLLRDVIADPGDVVSLLEAHAPYTPLGGWYNPGADPHARTRPMWFQNDWVHDHEIAAGSELFLHHPGYIEAAKSYYDATVVEPHSVYVNHMMALAAGGPAHTDNPRFHGRDRTNTPMWLLRTMLWSGLFERFEIAQATAIWWLNDVAGGGLLYWADGPDQAPREHVGAMANTALVGDNHKMFHQVGPVGPAANGTPLVSPSAQLAPVAAGEWAVVDHGEEVFRAPLDTIRVSVLWKADVYRTEAERDARQANPLSMADVASIFDADHRAQANDLRLDLEQLETAELQAAFARAYPEPRPVGALLSVYDR